MDYPIEQTAPPLGVIKCASQAGNIRLRLTGTDSNALLHSMGVVLRLAEVGLLTSIDSIASADKSMFIVLLVVLQWKVLVRATAPRFTTGQSRLRQTTQTGTTQLDGDFRIPDDLHRLEVTNVLRRGLIRPLRRFIRLQSAGYDIKTSICDIFTSLGLETPNCLFDPDTPSIILLRRQPDGRGSNQAITMDDVYRFAPDMPCLDLLASFLSTSNADDRALRDIWASSGSRGLARLFYAKDCLAADATRESSCARRGSTSRSEPARSSKNHQRRVEAKHAQLLAQTVHWRPHRSVCGALVVTAYPWGVEDNRYFKDLFIDHNFTVLLITVTAPDSTSKGMNTSLYRQDRQQLRDAKNTTGTSPWSTLGSSSATAPERDRTTNQLLVGYRQCETSVVVPLSLASPAIILPIQFEAHAGYS